MKKRTDVWLAAVAVLVFLCGVQPAWAGRRRRCCSPAPVAVQAKPQVSPAATATETKNHPSVPPAPAGPPHPAAPWEDALAARQKLSGSIKNLRCELTSWHYVSGLGGNARCNLQQDHTLEFVTKNRWSVRTQDMDITDPRFDIGVRTPLPAVHWLCIDNTFVLVDPRLRVVEKWSSKEGLLGLLFDETPFEIDQRIPIWFLTHLDAQHWKERFHIQVMTPREYEEKEIWLDLRPKTKADRREYRRAILRLKVPGLEPYAVRIYNTDGNYQSTEIRNLKYNDAVLERRGIVVPSVPAGWTFNDLTEPKTTTVSASPSKEKARSSLRKRRRWRR